MCSLESIFMPKRSLLSLMLMMFLSVTVNADDFSEFQTIRHPIVNSPEPSTIPLPEIGNSFPFQINVTFNDSQVGQSSFCQLNSTDYEYYFQNSFGLHYYQLKDRENDFQVILSSYGNSHELGAKGFSVISLSDRYGEYSLSSKRQQEVAPNGTLEGGKVFMAFNNDSEILYLINNKNAFSAKVYSEFDTRAKNPFIYENIIGVKYYQMRLYVLTNIFIDVYKTEGLFIIFLKRLDAAFFGVNEISIADLAFKAKYAFVVDELKGIFVVDVSKDRADKTDDLQNMFQYVPDLFISHPGAKFVEIYSSIIIVSGKTTNEISEYFIQEDNIHAFDVKFNRNISISGLENNTEIKHIILDSKFLYIGTKPSGLFVVFHSIPARFLLEEHQNPLLSFQSGMETFVYTNDQLQKGLLLLREGQIGNWQTIYIPPKSYVLNCLVSDAPGCNYAYELKAVSTKEKWDTDKFSDPDSVYITTQKVEIPVTDYVNPCKKIAIPLLNDNSSAANTTVQTSSGTTQNPVVSSNGQTGKLDDSSKNETQQASEIDSSSKNENKQASDTNDPFQKEIPKTIEINTASKEEISLLQKEVTSMAEQIKTLTVILIIVSILVVTILSILVWNKYKESSKKYNMLESRENYPYNSGIEVPPYRI